MNYTKKRYLSSWIFTKESAWIINITLVTLQSLILPSTKSSTTSGYCFHTKQANLLN